MSASNVRMKCMDGFGSRLKKRLDEVDMTPRQCAMRSGVDYPNLTKLINDPSKGPTPQTLNRLQKIPEIRDLILLEKEEQMVNYYGADSVLDAALKVLKEDPKRASRVTSQIRALLNGQ